MIYMVCIYNEERPGKRLRDRVCLCTLGVWVVAVQWYCNGLFVAVNGGWIGYGVVMGKVVG